MAIDQLILLFTLVIAANLVLLLALQLPRMGRRGGAQPDAFDASTRPADAAATAAAEEGPGGFGRAAARQALLGTAPVITNATFQRMARVVSFVFVGSAMAIVVLTEASEMVAITVLLAFGLLLIELFQDILPRSTLGRLRGPLEVVVVLAFLTALIVLTGGQASPFFFGYFLLVGAAALSSPSIGSLMLLALISSLAYVGAVVFVAAGSTALSPADLGSVAFNLVALALVMYVGATIGREQRRAREDALGLSRFDALTLLHSREYFLTELEQEIQRAGRTGRPFALALVDLDGLKYVNDHFGHDWGDKLLRATADVMRGDIRVTDIAARLGGDEFVLMLPETDMAGAINVAEKVRVDIARVELPQNGSVVRSTASIGLATFPVDGRSSAELLRQADQAMFEAKRRGRNQVARFAHPDDEPPQPPAPAAPARPAPSSGPGRAVPAATPGPAPWERA